MLERKPTDDELVQIEAQGFKREKVQSYLNHLERTGEPTDIKTATMLRGAFNDLLSQIPEPAEIAE